MGHSDPVVTAYAAAAQVLAAAAIRQLAFLEFEDEDVSSVAVECSRDGTVTYTLCNAEGFPIGGGSL